MSLTWYAEPLHCVGGWLQGLALLAHFVRQRLLALCVPHLSDEQQRVCGSW
jgi:hypothetical protein